jgi:hypothetical protein
MKKTKLYLGVAIASVLLAAHAFHVSARPLAPGGGGGGSAPPKSAPPAQAKPPAAASKYDEYFASKIDVVSLGTAFGRDTSYAVLFTPTKNEYSYYVELAGKNAAGGNACWRGDQAIRFGLEELKNMKVVTQVGGKLQVNADKGQDGATVGGSAEGSASVNQTKEIDVNRVFGRKYERNPLIVFREFHYRVVVSDGNRVLYATPWNGQGLPGGDIRQWDWPSSCAWVKQPA